ncbi:MAG: SdpI family protein [Candidatus Micrarchaeia archaeon]|jgi:uncharacterized membrane protein
MFADKHEFAAFSLAALSLLVSALAYPLLPGTVATHWNAEGAANGSSDKSTGAFIVPLITIALLAFLRFVPSIDPLGKNISQFQSEFGKFKLALSGFMLALNAGTLAYNLGFVFNFGYLMAPLLAMLFWFVGDLCASAKPNWFIGVRTPWTLSSPKVWEKTNRLAGKLFKASAIIALLGLLSVQNAAWFAIAPVLAAAVYLFFYSYFEFRKERAGKGKR